MVWSMEGLSEVDGEVLKVGFCDGCILNDSCSLILGNEDGFTVVGVEENSVGSVDGRVLASVGLTDFEDSDGSLLNDGSSLKVRL